MNGPPPPFRVIISRVRLCPGSPIYLEVFVVLGDSNEPAATTSAIPGVHGIRYRPTYSIRLTAVFSNLERSGAGCLVVPFRNPVLGSKALGCGATQGLFENFQTDPELLPTFVFSV